MLLAPSTPVDTASSTPGVHPSKIPFAGQSKLQNVGYTKLTAHTRCVWINRLLGVHAMRHIKTLAFPSI
jgi:hypothetical protein